MILAFETATNICSVALKNKQGTVYEKRIEKRGAHSEKLFLFAQELMKEQEFETADLAAVLVSEGPGSYTGLRIAASGIKGLLFGSKVPLYGVQTLASYALEGLKQHPGSAVIHSVIDARRVHLYHQSFSVKAGGLTTEEEVTVRPIKQLEAMIQPDDVIIGTGLSRISAEVLEKATVLNSDFISARSLINLFESNLHAPFVEKQDPASFAPKYYTSRQVG